MSMRLRCGISALIGGYFHPYRLDRLEITALYVHSPPFQGTISILTNSLMCIKVVKSVVHGPILLARNYYTKLVTLQSVTMGVGANRRF